MNPDLKDPRHPWSRLTAAARQMRDSRDESAPYGFATRIAALAFTPERTMASLLERFALKAVGVASLLALFSVVLNYSELASASSTIVAQTEEIEINPADDAVALVLGIAD
jgi:hypothetical protein